MAESDLWRGMLEDLEVLISILMEDADELAVSASLPDLDDRASRHVSLRQVGADIVTLADACEVVLQRAQAR